MEYKTFGHLKVGDKLYVFNTNKKDNSLIKDIIIESIVYPLEVSFNIEGFVCKVTLNNYYSSVFEENGIIYATTKQGILGYMEHRVVMLKNKISYREKENESLKEKIVKNNENIEEYKCKKSDFLSFIGKLKK